MKACFRRRLSVQRLYKDEESRRERLDCENGKLTW